MDNEELLLKMAKMDEEAEKRAEERDKRWQLAEEMREKERMKHEERQTQQMMMMMSNFMCQISSMMMPQYPLSSPFSYTPTDYTVHPSPSSSFSSTSNQYETDGNNPNTSTANN